MSTLTPTQRERLLATLGARQAAEEGKDFPTPPPDPPEALRLPDPWYRRFRDELPGFGQVLLECITGRRRCGSSCPTREECQDRADRRHDRFWGILELLAVAGILAYGLWVWRPQ
jgi:hypothetical protein